MSQHIATAMANESAGTSSIHVRPQESAQAAGLDVTSR